MNLTVLPGDSVEQPQDQLRTYELPRVTWPDDDGDPVTVTRLLPPGDGRELLMTEVKADMVVRVTLTGGIPGAVYGVGFDMTLFRVKVGVPTGEPAPTSAPSGILVKPGDKVSQHADDQVIYELTRVDWGVHVGEGPAVLSTNTLRPKEAATLVAEALETPPGGSGLVRVSKGQAKAVYEVVRTVTTRTQPTEVRRRAFQVEVG